MALVVAVALPVVAGILYFTVGKPDALTDDPPAPAGEAAKGDYIEQLQSHLSRQPRDGRGWVLLARAQADRNEFKAAADAYEKALTVSEKVAKDPGVLCEYADALGMTQGGRLAGRPAELIAKALSINPAHPVALEMAGSVAYEEGRYADAVRVLEAAAGRPHAGQRPARGVVRGGGAGGAQGGGDAAALSAGSLREPGQRPRQPLHALRVVLAGFRELGMLDRARHQFEERLVERLARGGELLRDRVAVVAFLDHALHGAQLALDALQSQHQFAPRIGDHRLFTGGRRPRRRGLTRRQLCSPARRPSSGSSRAGRRW